MKGVVVVGNNLSPALAKEECSGSFVVGADKGALYCCKNDIPMDVAVGDFDSLNEKETARVCDFAKKVVRLNPVKDETDTAFALSLLKDFEEIVILGGIQGKRIEHFLAILDLLAKDGRVCLKDDNSSLNVLFPGAYVIEKGPYQFFSLFAVEDSLVSLEGFAYPLENYVLKRLDPLGVSNQINDKKGHIILKKGKLLLIRSKSDS